MDRSLADKPRNGFLSWPHNIGVGAKRLKRSLIATRISFFGFIQFWIYPEGKIFDAKDTHRKHYPKGFRHILDDEPDYGGFLRGRIATSLHRQQLIVIYCRPENLVSHTNVPIDEQALVISDNGDIFGTVDDMRIRAVV